MSLHLDAQSLFSILSRYKSSIACAAPRQLAQVSVRQVHSTVFAFTYFFERADY